MNCKNCQTSLETTHNFCGHCGAKVIRNRLTFKNLWLDFRERFLNYDNTFLKTFVDLFQRPEKVIVGYISGTRKQYMDPISYFGIALTLSGLLVFLTQRVFKDVIETEVFSSELNQEVFQNIYESAMDFQALVFVVLIPLMAFCSWLTLNKHRHNFSEHVVTFTYILAHFTTATFPISLAVLAIDASHYTTYGILNVLAMILFSIYVYKRITQYGLGNFIFRAGLYMSLFFVLYIILSNIIFLILILLGVFTMQDLVPPK